MFRFTVHGSQANAWFQTCSSSESPKKRRIYRWGNLWGILDLQTLDWIVEERSIINETEETCLERVNILKIHAPPTKVDDVWDEEFRVWKDAVWNGVVSVCLPGSHLAIWCARNGFDAKILREEAASSTHQTDLPQPRQQHQQHQQHQQQRQQRQQYPPQRNNSRPMHSQRRQCLILDD